MRPNSAKLKSLPVGLNPDNTSTSPEIDMTVAPSIDALMLFDTCVVAAAMPPARLPAPDPPTATTTIVVVSSAFTRIFPRASTTVEEPDMIASVLASTSLTAITIPAALLPAPEPPPATQTRVSALLEVTSNVVKASTSEPFFISA